jgi:hypothetical protein
MVVDEEFLRLFLAKLFQWISPKDIAHKAMSRRFSEAIDLRVSVGGLALPDWPITYRLEVLKGVQLWAQAAMNAEKLLVHDCSKRKSAERFHACFVYFLGVLVLAFQLESKVIGQVAAFVVTTEEP